MSKETARRVLGWQILAESWDHFVDQEWDHPQYGLSEDNWHAILEEPFLSYPDYQNLTDALEVLGGDINE